MKRYLYIGKKKKPLIENYNDKCKYLKNLSSKRQNEFQNFEKIKKEIVFDKILNKDELFQRDYAFFSFLKPSYIIEKKFPKIKIYPGFKYTFKSPSEKYHSYKIYPKNEYYNVNKKSLIYFPRAVKTYMMNKSSSAPHLPIIN